MNFFIPIEIKNRDYLSRLLIAYYASKKGYNVYIGSKSKIDTFVRISKPGIYLGLVTTKTYSQFYKELKKKNFKIFVIDEEGLITFDDKMYLDLKVSKDTIENIETLFTWGDEHRKIIIKKFPEFASKIISTGTPRFDLFDIKLRKVFENKVEKIQNQFDEFTLICGSFSFVNHFTKNLNYLEVLKSQNVIKNDEDERRFLKYCKYNKESFHNFIYLTKQLSKNHKNHNFIYRPHPAENSAIYKEEFKNFKNIFVKDNYTLIEWIIASKCIVHSYCTSSIEALLVDKTRFGLKENFDSEVHKTIPYEFSNISLNVDELIKNCGDFIEDNKFFEDKKIYNKDNLKRYISNISNEMSAQRIIDKINTLYPPLLNKNNNRINQYIFKFLNIFRNLKGHIRSYSDSYKKHKIYLEHKIGNIDFEEVSKHLQFFNQKKLPIILKKIDKNLFLLKKDN
tara:strand:- start:2 stop:1357 length:1356 start_codon:yes stop_codon:yes gene_type:complete